MALFEPGKILKDDAGATIKIIKHLADGGQGDVYVVEYMGKKKALKWYKPDVLSEPDAFYKNLEKNAGRKSPDKAFLWPEAITERRDGSFGYIMDLKPDGYEELSKYLGSDDCNFASFKSATEACIRIVSAFRILHNNGYSYQDLNDGNFFIEPTTGDVRICDNDNVAPNGTHTRILGKPRYMAPEIVVGDGKVLPNTQSDRHSLAVILFLVLFCGHPLEGEHWCVPCMTDELAKLLYGIDPIFIFDPNDRSNRPKGNVHIEPLKRWPCMPDYVKELFLMAFSKQALKDPNHRPRELDWLNMLVRFRSDIVNCPCGDEVFIRNSASAICDCCGRTIVIKNRIKLPHYSITAAKGSRIYRCQLGTCNPEDALEPIALVVAKPDGTLGVKNMTPYILKAFTPGGKEKLVHPQEIIPFISGIKIEVFDKTIELN